MSVSAWPITFRAWIPNFAISHSVSRSAARSSVSFRRIDLSLVPTISIPIAVQFMPIAWRHRMPRFTSW